MKKKGLIIAGVIVAAVVIIIALFAGTYNGMVEDKGNVDAAQAEIQTQLQRRADLIPNFVATVQGYSDYEQETYTAVTAARTAVQNATDAGELNDANNQLDSAIDIWVNAVTEAYPELKANENYIALQDELAGTENRIAKARSNYNEAATEYNVSIKKFPKNIFAGMFGFDSVELFTATDSAQEVPSVSFD